MKITGSRLTSWQLAGRVGKGAMAALLIGILGTAGGDWLQHRILKDGILRTLEPLALKHGVGPFNPTLHYDQDGAYLQITSQDPMSNMGKTDERPLDSLEKSSFLISGQVFQRLFSPSTTYFRHFSFVHEKGSGEGGKGQLFYGGDNIKVHDLFISRWERHGFLFPFSGSIQKGEIHYEFSTKRLIFSGQVTHVKWGEKALGDVHIKGELTFSSSPQDLSFQGSQGYIDLTLQGHSRGLVEGKWGFLRKFLPLTPSPEDPYTFRFSINPEGGGPPSG